MTAIISYTCTDCGNRCTRNGVGEPGRCAVCTAIARIEDPNEREAVRTRLRRRKVTGDTANEAD